jgi:hypothetical protein
MLTHSPRIITDGLVLCLDAANRQSYPGSGTVWTDLTDSKKGDLTNGPGFSSMNGGSIVLDGSNDFVNVPFSAQFPTGSSARTLCSWFYATSIAGGREIFGIGANSFTGNRSSLWIDASNNIGVECANTAVLTSSWSGINNWVYLCSTFESGGNTHSFKIYVNGTQKSVTLSGSAVTLNSASTSCVIGTVPAATSAHMFVGNIAQVSIYNRALTAQEILQNYNATKGRYNL